MTAPDTFGQLAARVERLGGVASAILKSQSEMRAQLRVATRHELTGSEKFVRHAAVRIAAEPPRRTVEEVAAQFYNVKATTPLGVSDVPEWLGRLTASDALDFLDSGAAPSVFAELAALGRTVDPAGQPVSSIPYRRNGQPVGGWVGQAAPIPVVQALLDSLMLEGHKLGSIAAVSIETARSPRANVEGFVRSVLRSDLIRIVDQTLLSDAAGTPASPPGLLSGIAPLTPAAPGADAALTDLRALGAEVMTGGGRALLYIMNPLQLLSLSTLPNVPNVITSPDIEVATVIALDPTAFCAVVGDASVDASGETLLHMSDTPAPIIGGTAPQPQMDDIAAPVRSLWQTASVGVRSMIENVAWGIANSTISWMEGVKW